MKGDNIEILRQATMKRTVVKLKNEMLVFGGDIKLDLKAETAWQSKQTGKRYNLGSLWKFLQFEGSGRPLGSDYNSEVAELGLDMITQLDRDEVSKYFRGEKDSSEDINPELRLLLNTKNEKVVPQLDPETMDIFHLIDWGQKFEKPISSKSKQMRTPARSYEAIIHLFTDMERKKHTEQRKRNKPIIVVPQVEIPGNVCMRNIRQLLLDGDYIEPQRCPEVVQQKLEINYKGRVLEVISDPEFLDKDQWARVVAIFVTGRKSQFHSWPEVSVGTLFSKYRAFFVKWLEAAIGQAKDWNVCVLNVHSVRRHENKQLQKRFWTEVSRKLEQLSG